MSHFQSFLLASLLLSPNYSQTDVPAYHQWQWWTRYLDNCFPGGTFPATLHGLKMWVSIRGGARGRPSAAQLQIRGVQAPSKRPASTAAWFCLDCDLPASPGREASVPGACCPSSFPAAVAGVPGTQGEPAAASRPACPELSSGMSRGSYHGKGTFLLCWLEEADVRGRLKTAP